MIILLSNLSTLVYNCIHYKSSKILFSVHFFSILRIDTKICDMIFPENNTQDCITLSYFQADNNYIESEVCEVCAKNKLQDTVDASYKGHLYRGTAA